MITVDVISLSNVRYYYIDLSMHKYEYFLAYTNNSA